MNRRRRRILAALSMSATIGFAAHPAMSTTCPTPASSPDLVTYEDGSGVLYQGDKEIRTYPEDTFPWDCRTMGNKTCGADMEPNRH